MPKPGEPGSETWQGKDIEHGGAPTWFTGSYDAGARHGLLADGQSGQGVQRRRSPGRQPLRESILALDRKTGKLRWHYQFTPHDLWDWDATQTSVLVDADWEGQPRKLMLHADRNGFFYVFDRENGKLLLAKAVRQEPDVGERHRRRTAARSSCPIRSRSPAGTKVCPSQDGATNWFSPSFNPATGLYYVQTFEKCSIYTKSDQGPWESGKTYLGGSQRTAPGSEAAADSEGDRHPHRRDSLGAAAARAGPLLGRDARDGHRPRHLR